MIKYKIVEEGEDVLIEKSGHTLEFTASSVKQNEKKFEKEITQLNAQLMLEEAKMINVTNNHEFVKDLTDEQKHTVHLYWEASLLAKQCLEAINARKEALAEYEEVRKEVKKQTGVKI